MSIDSEFGRDSLEKNLGIIGINNLDFLNIEIIDYSPSTSEGNIKIYKHINEILQELIKREQPGEYIHITGEMRALKDPNHRTLIKELFELHKYRINIVYYLPHENEITGYKILKFNQEHWENATWIDYLDAMDILGGGKAKLYCESERALIHYSVFGDDIVLFQSEHHSHIHVKEVWILKSKLLWEKFYLRAKRILQKSEYIHPIIINRFLLSISNSISLHVLISLYHKEAMKKEELNNEIEKLDKFNEFNIQNLILIGFLKKINDSIYLSEEGKEYIKLFLNERKR